MDRAILVLRAVKGKRFFIGRFLTTSCAKPEAVNESKNEFGIVRTRYSPRPTVSIHIRSQQTIPNNVFARSHPDGRFILRIEDTDRERMPGPAEQLESVSGMESGQQSQGLLDEDNADRCFCTKDRYGSKNRDILHYDNFSRSQVQLEEKRFSSTGKEVEKYPEGKPNWEKLQHICIRLRETWPKFFVMKMDYTVFRDDVILDDRIYGKITRGVNNYRTYIAFLAGFGRIFYPQIEMHIMSLTPFIEDATVRLRWRVYYMNILDWVIMLARFKPFSADYMMKNGRIMDGYSIYHVDASGAVYRHVVDRVIPDDEKGLAKGRLTLPQRLMALLGGSPAPKQAAPTP